MLRFTKILKIRKTQLALAVILALGFSLIPIHGAEAAGSIWDMATGTAGDAVSGVLLGVINALLSIIVSVLGLMLGGIAMMADSVMQPVAITTNATVQLGWGITRDFANMFFILILLGIALDFIMFNSFKVKQMIPRLILIALLINFSLPIAGVLIDFANVFTQFFLSQASEGAGLTGKIANDLNIQNVLDVTIGNFGTGNVGNLQWNLLKTLLFGILFMFGTAFIFLALALMFLVRTGYLYVLLITLPLVLVLSAFPPTAGRFGQWTSKFVQWTMFAPIATFFLWFAILMFHELIGKNITEVSEDSFITSLYKYIVIWVLLLGALTAAQSMGGKAAGMAMGAAGWVKGKTLKGLKGAGGRTAALGARTLGVEKGAETLARGLESRYGRLFTLGAGGVAARSVRTAGGYLSKASEKQEELTAQEKEAYKNMSKSNRRGHLENMRKSQNKMRLAQYEALQSQEEDGLRVFHSDGTLDTTGTARAKFDAWKNANKFHKKSAKDIYDLNADARQIITEADILEDEQITDPNKRKYTNVAADENGIIQAVIRATGETTKEKIERERDHLTARDFERAKGLWSTRDIQEGFRTGAFVNNVDQIARATDTNLLKSIQKELNNLNTVEKAQLAITNWKRFNKEATNTVRSGYNARFGLTVVDDLAVREILLSETGKKAEKGYLRGEVGGTSGEEPSQT